METTMRAGMVDGTPDWQLDRMYEDESARIWAALNAEPVRTIDQISVLKRINASADLETAIMADIEPALNWLASAQQEVTGTEAAEKIGSLYDRLSDILMEMKEIQQEIRRER